ncbi:hypothetical protein NDN08_002783 [Rhodosorus marinus]|uniref:Uncharacterized protein n=1 Tax=Rhodosorus marinus TaxID=101924 RepID=A0AAV8UUP3_9RHOD|nr:hypothetical protein NDN08_002783 [Rhodosorus marinus]
MSVPLPRTFLLRGAGSFSFDIVLKKKGGLTLIVESGGNGSQVLELNESHLWSTGWERPSMDRKTAYLLGKESAQFLRRDLHIGRLWYKKDDQKRRSLSSIARPSSHGAFHEAVRGLLHGGVQIELELSMYLGALNPRLSPSREFWRFIEPLERCGLEVLWPESATQRARYARSLLWGQDAIKARIASPHDSHSDDLPKEVGEEDSLEKLIDRQVDERVVASGHYILD